MSQKSYTVSICGLTRPFPLLEVAPGVQIAIFNMLGDTEIVKAAARELAARLPASGQVIVTPAEKSIPLAYELSVQTGLPYVVVRKVRKPYMANCLSAEVVSITTGAPQTLYMDGKDLHLVQGKKAALVDDVISTGSTLRGMRLLMKEASADVVAEMAVFTEGDDGDWADVISLGHLPVFAG